MITIIIWIDVTHHTDHTDVYHDNDDDNVYNNDHCDCDTNDASELQDEKLIKLRIGQCCANGDDIIMVLKIIFIFQTK